MNTDKSPVLHLAERREDDDDIPLEDVQVAPRGRAALAHDHAAHVARRRRVLAPVGRRRHGLLRPHLHAVQSLLEAPERAAWDMVGTRTNCRRYIA